MKTCPEKLRFRLFADLHYKKGMYIPTVADLETILRRAHEGGAELVIHVGDFCNDYSRSPEIVRAYLQNGYGLPAYGVYGNHELESQGNSMAVVTPLLTNRPVTWGSPDGSLADGSVGYYYTDIRAFRLVCLDTCYSQSPATGEWEHNTTASYGAPAGNRLADSLDPVQLAWLETVLTDAARKEKTCLVFSHVGFSGLWPSSPSADTVRGLFAGANAMRPGTVVAAFSGHLHTNRHAVRDGVVYVDMHTVRNTLWVPHDRAIDHYEGVTYPFAAYDEGGREVARYARPVSELSMAKNTWFSEEPLSAGVTVGTDGHVELEGSESAWLAGVAPPFALGEEAAPRVRGGVLKAE